MTLIDLPPMPTTAHPVIVPGLLSGLGIVPHPVPAWITDPDFIDSIERGLMEIPAEFMGETRG